jgi:hypothetical protein
VGVTGDPGLQLDHAATVGFASQPKHATVALRDQTVDQPAGAFREEMLAADLGAHGIETSPSFCRLPTTLDANRMTKRAFTDLAGMRSAA